MDGLHAGQELLSAEQRTSMCCAVAAVRSLFDRIGCHRSFVHCAFLGSLLGGDDGGDDGGDPTPSDFSTLLDLQRNLRKPKNFPELNDGWTLNG